MPAPTVRAVTVRAPLLGAAALLLAACRPAIVPPAAPAPGRVPTVVVAPPPSHAIVPLPVEVRFGSGAPFVVDTMTTVHVRFAGGWPAADDRAAVERVARQLTGVLGGVTRPAPRVLAEGQSPAHGGVLLQLDTARADLGAEGYVVTTDTAGVTIVARRPAGLFYGAQTLRQLLPASIEHPAAYRRTLRAPAAHVRDVPRYEWRGAMLDVSRHFLAVEDVKRFIDVMALYKLNRLHLHLSDDQGWRVEIASWPNLARHGGSTEVGGGPGGYYTIAQLADLVAYARDRFITIVPEIDVPGHTNAALASYPELNCDGVAPPLYTGIRVGFSALCVEREDSYRFLRDVVREIGAVTGPWFHIGGDEVEKLTHPQYLRFIERAEEIVRGAGKRMVGWGEIAPARLDTSTIVQHWRGNDSTFVHAARGGRVLMSPARRAYMDMKYDSTTTLGLRWAGLVEVRDAYDWDPATYLPRVPASAVVGVEAPLWSETLEKREDFELMAFPRLIAIAEVGWSPQAGRDWPAFQARLAAHGPRLSALGVNFYRSPQIPWAR